MAAVKKLYESQLAYVKYRYFVMEPITTIISLVNWGSNTQGIYILSK